MTVKHLRELLNAVSHLDEGKEIQIWMPGTRIAIHGETFRDPSAANVILLEGTMKGE